MPIRKNLSTSCDPYIPKKGMGKAITCKECGAVYRNKRWSLNGPPAESRAGADRRIICPACRKIRDKYPNGIIMLTGPFLELHKDEILRLARNEERRALRINPLARIFAIKDHGRSLEIQTTSERFAQRIGREIQRAFKGRTTYHWAREDKQIRVYWHREESYGARAGRQR